MTELELTGVEGPAAVGAALPAQAAPHSLWRDSWRALARDRAALAGGLLVAVFVLLAALAAVISPHNPARQNSDGLTDTGSPVPPSAKYPLGTDALGRDVLSRLLWGARVSLGIGIASNFTAVGIGVLAGALAGFYGAATETLIMRFVDILMGFPVLLLSVALVSVLEPSPLTIVIVIAFVNWTYLSRIVYNAVRSLKHRDFVAAAQALGASRLFVLVRHILPQLTSIIVVYASLGIATSVLLESTLSYIGIGVPPPTASWGNMISEGQRYYRSAPWLVLYPGLCIGLTVLAFNLLGDGLRDATDPHARTRARH